MFINGENILNVMLWFCVHYILLDLNMYVFKDTSDCL